MPPHTLTETESAPAPLEEVIVPKTSEVKYNKKKLIQVSILHIGALYGFYLCLSGRALKSTILIGYIYGVLGGIGITGGSHRLWSHRSYKAKLPLRIALMLMSCIANQGTIYKWSRDHRVHHKYTDTNADPYNAKRGFFFSHIGWLLVPKHPDVISKGDSLDMSDILNDPVVQFQKRHYGKLCVLMSMVVPMCLVVGLVNETWWNAYFVLVMMRYCYSLHITWLVNSAAHMWGFRPYDHNITPRENLFVSFLGSGEGFHNYHHTFPWDYSTSEYGMKLNLTTSFINLMALLGQAYDLRSVTPEMIKNRKKRTGELTHSY